MRDSEIFAEVIDYSSTYPERGGDIIGRVSYADLRSGEVELDGKAVATGSMSSYSKALKISELLKEEIKKGAFLLNKPFQKLPVSQAMTPLDVRAREKKMNTVEQVTKRVILNFPKFKAGQPNYYQAHQRI